MQVQCCLHSKKEKKMKKKKKELERVGRNDENTSVVRYIKIYDNAHR